MTLFKPAIQVRRLAVTANGRWVYNEQFHDGVNIIRGANSSGKSTLLNFLFYGLGGDLATWSDVAQRCSTVFVEVDLSGKRATLRREVSQVARQPMDIFGGDFDLAMSAPSGEWQRYPYARSAARESFSQRLFSLLEIPEAHAEATGNVTVNQVLRLLYADQLSPIDSIFRFEQFDPPLMRDTIGRLLCGAFSNEHYTNEIRVKDLQKSLDEVNSELKSVMAVLGRADQNPTSTWIHAERSALVSKRQTLVDEISEAEAKAEDSGREQVSLAEQKAAYNELAKIQFELGQAQTRRDALALEIDDSERFISDLDGKLVSLNNAKAVGDEVGNVAFNLCPACHAPLDEAQMVHACHLCKTPFDSERLRSRLVTLINDTAVQLRQSRSLQEDRRRSLTAATADLERLHALWRTASARYDEARRNPTTKTRARLNELQRLIGYIDRQIEDLENRAKLVAVLEELRGRREELSAEIAKLKARNEALRLEQSARLSSAYTAISDEVRWFLTNDLPRQDAFLTARSIEFDFGANRLTVDGQSYFSASSRVILRNSFFVGFMFAATEKSSFRHPRYVMLDSIEDKGMEQERSFHFQKLIVDRSSAAKADHQVIFCTSMIAPELEGTEYTVGRAYTREQRTLDF